jgi:hypothetical protein
MQQPSGNNSTQMSAKLVALETEYAVTLKMYEEAYKNYSETLKNSVAVIEENPCGGFAPTSTNISQACYDKVWRDAGCPTKARDMKSDDWFSKQTLNTLKSDSNQWATLDTDEHKVGCYGSTAGKSATDTGNLAAIKGYTFWGTSAISSDASTSEKDCMTKCANDKKCTGATFNTSKQLCWIRTGDGEIEEGLSDDYAIVSKLKQQAFVLKNINDKLTQLNSDIMTEMSSLFGQASSPIDSSGSGSQGDSGDSGDLGDLGQYAGLFKPSKESIRLNKLVEDKKEIDDAIKQLEGTNPINGEFADSFVQVKQSRIFYMLLCIVALILIGVAMRNSVATIIIVVLVLVIIFAIVSVSKS